jgi:hypothetical protein
MSVLNLSPEPDQEKIYSEKFELERRAKDGANWFFWIAALTLLNSIITFTGGNWGFVTGLGITQLFDGFVDQLTGSGTFSVARIVVLVIDFLIVGFFVLCGLWAKKFFGGAFIVGMIIYFLDGLLLLLLEVYLSAGFHLLALIFIFRGFLAARELNAAEKTSLA